MALSLSACISSRLRPDPRSVRRPNSSLLERPSWSPPSVVRSSRGNVRRTSWHIAYVYRIETPPFVWEDLLTTPSRGHHIVDAWAQSLASLLALVHDTCGFESVTCDGNAKTSPSPCQAVSARPACAALLWLLPRYIGIVAGIAVCIVVRGPFLQGRLWHSV